jgi:hypothetical protein
LSSLTLSLTIGQASSSEGEVLDCRLAALLATRLARVSSMQSLEIHTGISRHFIRLTVAVVLLNHCFQGPAESSFVAHGTLTCSFIVTTTKKDTVVDYCVCSQEAGKFPGHGSHRHSIICSSRINCAVTAELKNFPVNLQRRSITTAETS